MNANKIAELIADTVRQPLWENWYIKEKIGSGTFCNVYRIEARRTNRTDTAALKIEPILSDERFNDDEQRKKSYIEKRKQSVVNETEIMYMLKDCPNIVAYQEEDLRELYIDGKFEGYYLSSKIDTTRFEHWNSTTYDSFEFNLVSQNGRLQKPMKFNIRENSDCFGYLLSPSSTSTLIGIGNIIISKDLPNGAYGSCNEF